MDNVTLRIHNPTSPLDVCQFTAGCESKFNALPGIPTALVQHRRSLEARAAAGSLSAARQLAALDEQLRERAV